MPDYLVNPPHHNRTAGVSGCVDKFIGDRLGRDTPEPITAGLLNSIIY